ncbi:hypothetical protein A2U01_0086537 [Trifolium medium]|uniref:Uncharacterized protein n=1 Tax=Trifolium medium TaxID=97028 RepID=A0A392TWE7_9FABA|nr:hypothetical protein [Trifolium medium]
MQTAAVGTAGNTLTTAAVMKPPVHVEGGGGSRLTVAI